MKEQHLTVAETAAINSIPKNSLVESVTKTVGNGSNHDCSPKQQQTMIENLGDKGILMGSVTQIDGKTVDCTNSNVGPDLGPTVSSVAITQTNGLDGLNSKPKATWVRLNRMECGLSESARDICTPSLGKRAATSTLFAEHEEHH